MATPKRSSAARKSWRPILAAESTLAIEDVYAGYGTIDILNGVNLRTGPGEFIALMGPNGAGKSTLLKTIFGMTTFKRGAIRWKGNDIGGGRTPGIPFPTIRVVPPTPAH